MLARWDAWRRRQPTRILFVPVSTFGSTVVAAGLRPSRKYGVTMIEVHR